MTPNYIDIDDELGKTNPILQHKFNNIAQLLIHYSMQVTFTFSQSARVDIDIKGSRRWRRTSGRLLVEEARWRGAGSGQLGGRRRMGRDGLEPVTRGRRVVCQAVNTRHPVWRVIYQHQHQHLNLH